MKKYLLPLAFIFSFGFSLGVAQAAIVRVQTNTGSNDGSTNTVSATWGNSTAQGDLLVAIVGIMAEPTTTIAPPTPDWQLAVGVRSTTTGTNNITTAIYYIPNANSQSGPSTWTLPNQASGDVATLTLVEYSGVDPSNPLHTTGYSNYPNSQIPGDIATLGDSGTTTPGYNAGEVAVAGITTASGNTNFSGETNSFTEESEIASILTPMAPGIRTVFEDRMPTLAPGNQGVQATINGTYTTPTWAWAGAIATFNPAPETGTGGTDMCVNIDGVQTTVPDGYMSDAAGNCTSMSTGGTDMCMNIDGVQTTVPDGYVSDAAGNCVQSGNAAGGGITPFSDTSNSWASTYIQQLYSMGAVSGKTSTTFAPDQNLTRAEMVKIALLTFGYQVTAGATPTFKDVHAGDWFASYVAAAQKAGIVGGYADGTFRANSNITRGEALKILLTAAANAYNTQSDIFDHWGNVAFTDVDQSAWYANYVNFAFANGIVSGKTSTTFAPNDNVTRGEMSKMAVLATQKFLSALSHQPPAPASATSNLRVQIVVQTAPGVYAPLIAPANTVISVDPTTSIANGIIRCPTSPGVAFPATTQCSASSLSSTTHIKLTAIPATVIPNAIFYQWTDIQPFVNSNAFAISNGCIYTSFASSTTPSLDCSMNWSGAAKSREIQAVYKCLDTFVYNPATEQCEKPAVLAPCDLYVPPNIARTDCGLYLAVQRNASVNDDKVTVSLPTALPHPPSILNQAPSSPSTCVATSSGGSITCTYFYTSYPTPITLTASAANHSSGLPVTLPSTFHWAPGPCTVAPNSATSPTCTLNIGKDPLHPLLNITAIFN